MRINELMRDDRVGGTARSVEESKTAVPLLVIYCSGAVFKLRVLFHCQPKPHFKGD